MKYIVLYLDGCPYSKEAVKMLDEKEYKYTKIIFTDSLDINNSEKVKIPLLDNKEYLIGKEMLDKKIFKDYFGEESTFPRIYEGDKLIGGYTELKEKLSLEED